MSNWGQAGVAARRGLSGNPLFVLVSVAIFGAALGAGVALHSMDRLANTVQISGALHSARIVTLTLLDQNRSPHTLPLNFIEAVSTSSTVLEGAANHMSLDVSVATSAEVVRASAELVHGPYFDLLGVEFELGSGFEDHHFDIGAPRTVVVSELYWRNALGARKAAVGESILINDLPFQIVGVASDQFLGTATHHPTMLWIPFVAYATSRIAAPEEILLRSESEAFGLRRIGSTEEDIQSELQILRSNFPYPLQLTVDESTLAVFPGIEADPKRTESLRRVTRLWAGIAVLLILVAVLNIASLQLARLHSRHLEFSIRIAVGATIAQLRRQAIYEALILCALGTAVGVALAVWGRQLLLRIQEFSSLRRMGMTEYGATDLAYVLAVFVAGFATIAMIAFAVFRDEDTRSTRAEMRVTAVLHALGAGQVAVAVLVVAWALLGLNALANLERAQLGMSIENVYAARPQFESGSSASVHFSKLTSDLFALDLLESLERPGHALAAQVSELPFSDGLPFRLVSDEPSGSQSVGATILDVEPEFFGVLKIPLLAGRVPTDGDAGACVSQMLARQLELSVGDVIFQLERTEQKGAPKRYDIQCIVGDAAISGPNTESTPVLYRQYSSVPFAPIVIRTERDPRMVSRLLSNAVERSYPGLRVESLEPFSVRLADVVAPFRIKTLIASIGAVVVLLLAAAGVFAAIRNITERCRFQLAVRQALGARRMHVILFVAGATARLLLIAVGLSLPLVAFVFPYGAEWITNAWHPRYFVWVAVSGTIISAVIAAAAAGPCRLALRVRPADLLRVN